MRKCACWSSPAWCARRTSRAKTQIDLAKIAEARVAYGGKGTLSDIQQPPWGQQALNVLLPF